MKKKDRLSGGVVVVVLGAFAVLGLQTAHGGWLSDFTGFSVFVDPSNSADGVASFAVYELGDDEQASNIFPIEPTVQFGFGEESPLPLQKQIDEDATFVYFYQLVNTDPGGGLDVLTQYQVELQSIQSVTSAGYISGYVFNDPERAVESPGPVDKDNPGLGDKASDPEYDDQDTPGDGQPSYKGVSLQSPEFVNTGDNVVDPSQFRFQPTLVLAQWDFIEPNIIVSGYDSGGNFDPTKVGTSSVMWFTTREPQVTYSLGRAHDGLTAEGDVPAPIPAPSVLVGLLSCLPMAGLAALRRRRRKSRDHII